jgi:hypothetical protein
MSGVDLWNSSLTPWNRSSSKYYVKKLVRTAKKTKLISITKIIWLMLFEEIIPVCSENYTKPINTKWRFADC